MVLDCSVAAAWCFRDENSDPAVHLLDRLAAGAEAEVPALWWYEISNVMAVGERRGRIARADSARFLALLKRLLLTTDPEPLDNLPERLLELSLEGGVSAYDAAYLDLAQRRSAALTTLDRTLGDAAKKMGIEVL